MREKQDMAGSRKNRGDKGSDNKNRCKVIDRQRRNSKKKIVEHIKIPFQEEKRAKKPRQAKRIRLKKRKENHKVKPEKSVDKQDKAAEGFHQVIEGKQLNHKHGLSRALHEKQRR